MVEDMRNTFDTLKQDLNSSLPRQIRVVVQQVNVEAQGKRVETSPATPNLGTATGQDATGVLANFNHSGMGGGLNLQQYFY
jgi:hypothetical protein